MTKKKILTWAVASTLFATLFSATPASAATINSDPAISVNASGVVTLTNATWTGATSVTHQVYSCWNERLSASTVNMNGVSGCFLLYADTNGTQITTGFDIDNAYRSMGGSTYETYGPLSHGKHLVYVSTADNVFSDTRASASSFYVRQGIVTAPSLSITGTTATGTIGVISEPTQGTMVYFACDAAFSPASDANADRLTEVQVSGGSSSEIPGTNTANGGVIIGTAPNCVRLSVSSPFNLDGAQTVAGFSYNPAVDGAHIVAAQRLSVISAGNGNAYYFFSNSQLYTPPAPPTVSAQPQLSLSGSAISFTAATFSGGSGSSQDGIYACPAGTVVQITTPTSFGSTGLSSCKELYPGPNNYSLPSDLASAVVQVVAGGPPTYPAYDPATHGTEIVGVSSKNSLYVVTAPAAYGAASIVASPPYTGPVLQTPGPVAPVAQGSKLVIPGSNLSGVTKVEIGGLEAKVVVNSAGELEVVIPTGLAAGIYDLVVTSSSGKLTVQDGIRISAGASQSAADSDVRPSAKKNETEEHVKVRIFDIIGAGKVQILVNGKEIAWVNAKDASDSKLFDGYLVRTVKLAAGKNVIEVYVNGVRTQRWAYSG